MAGVVLLGTMASHERRVTGEATRLSRVKRRRGAIAPSFQAARWARVEAPAIAVAPVTVK